MKRLCLFLFAESGVLQRRRIECYECSWQRNDHYCDLDRGAVDDVVGLVAVLTDHARERHQAAARVVRMSML